MRRSRLALTISGIALAAISSHVFADNDARYAQAPDAIHHEHEGQLSPQTRRALRRFNEHKHRDYRRLGERRFDSDRARERAYQKLRREHRDKLRNILGDSRFEEDDEHHDYEADNHPGHADGRGEHERRAARPFDPAAASAAIATRWALNENDQDELVDVLDDYAEDVREFDEERFDSTGERREARRELEQDFQDDLEDILDDVSDAEVSDILEHILHGSVGAPRTR